VATFPDLSIFWSAAIKQFVKSLTGLTFYQSFHFRVGKHPLPGGVVIFHLHAVFSLIGTGTCKELVLTAFAAALTPLC
jgi:hypothetical protein